MSALSCADGLRRLPLRLARLALLGAIRVYQRFLSPHKGFSCAYRVHTGRGSCSALGYRAVARYGVFRGLGVLGLRLDQCRLQHERHRARRGVAMRRQAGFVDGCGDSPCGDGLTCDGLGCDGLSVESLACDALNCLSCDDACVEAGCDAWGEEWRCLGWPRRRPAPVRERGRRRRDTPPSGPLDAMPRGDSAGPASPGRDASVE